MRHPKSVDLICFDFLCNFDLVMILKKGKKQSKTQVTVIPFIWRMISGFLRYSFGNLVG